MFGTTRNEIDDFLAQKRLAIVGVSRDPKDLSRSLFRDLRQRGYDMVPVNPAISEVEGTPCFARLQDVTPPVAGALVMTPAAKSEQVARDCAEAGVDRVWLYRGVGTGAVSQAAVDFCQRHGMHLVAGHCPYMFLPKTEFVHRLHGVFMRLTGGYPAH
jgi:predicted CoA-binding protein